MKKLICAVVVATLTLAAPLALAERRDRGREEKTRVFQDLTLKANEMEAAGSAGGGAPGALVVVSPQYYYSQHGTITTGTLTADGSNVSSMGGHLSGGGIAFAFNKEINDILRLTFAYQYTYSQYSGGFMLPQAAMLNGMYGQTDQDLTSHILAIAADVSLREYGRLNLSVVQGFDYADGDEWLMANGVMAERRSADDFSDRVTALMAWYEYDAKVNENWTFTPHLGWRTLYAHLMKANQWGEAADSIGAKANDHAWIHLGTLGAKLAYSDGPLGFNVRAGVNHRFTGDDLPGYGNRATAPGVVNIGYNVNFDQTVATFGAGFSYAIPEAFILNLGYDGFAGSDTDTHMFSLAAVFPF